MTYVLRLFAPFALVFSALGCGGSLVPGGGTPEPLFVAVGSNGTIVVSKDGVSWMAHHAGFTTHLFAVAAGPSRFVAVGRGGLIVHSTDGLVWEPAVSPTPYDLRDVVYANDRFVAVGEDWTAGAVALTSTDGVAWTTLDVPPATHMFHAVAYGGTSLVAAAYLRSDLQTPALFQWTPGGPWTLREGPDFYTSLSARGMILVAGGRPGVSLSADDGLSWETVTFDPGAASTAALAYDGTTFVAVGEVGAIHSSPDGRTWTSRENPLGFGGTWNAAAHGAGRFVAHSAGRVITSSDGVDWVAHNLPTLDVVSSLAFGPKGAPPPGP